MIKHCSRCCSQDVSNIQTFITRHHVKIITPPMIGVYSFDFNGPFMQVFYFSFLIAEATSLLFFLWWVARRIVMASVIRSLGITGISGYLLVVEVVVNLSPGDIKKRGAK